MQGQETEENFQVVELSRPVRPPCPIGRGVWDKVKQMKRAEGGLCIIFQNVVIILFTIIV